MYWKWQKRNNFEFKLLMQLSRKNRNFILSSIYRSGKEATAYENVTFTQTKVICKHCFCLYRSVDWKILSNILSWVWSLKKTLSTLGLLLRTKAKARVTITIQTRLNTFSRFVNNNCIICYYLPLLSVYFDLHLSVNIIFFSLPYLRVSIGPSYTVHLTSDYL